MKIAFIGLGNMAAAIIKGLRKSGQWSAGDILGYAPSKRSLPVLEAAGGISFCESVHEAAGGADIIVLAVKPQMFGAVLPQVKAAGLQGKLVVSIAAGKDFEYFERALGPEVAVVRVMPNINSKVGASTSAYCLGAKATPEHERAVREIFSTVGTVEKIDEKLFPVFSAVAGASPAFSYIYIDALARAAVKGGIPRGQAIKIAAGAVLGSARMILESGEHPCALADQVCSPGGSTIEGILRLQELGFEHAVHEAVQAVIDKDALLK